MANTLRFKRGLVAGIPNGALGEPLFTTDTFDLYIGNGTGNTRFQKYIASGATTQILRGDGSLYTFPLNISSPSNGQVLKYDGTNWVNSADAGVTGSGTAGQVTYWGSSSTITGSNNLFWDATNNRLGIGTNSPTRALQVQGTGFFADSLQVQRDFIGATTIRVGNSGTIDAATMMQFALSEDGATVNGYFRRYRNGSALTEIGFSNALTFMGAVTGTPAERMRIFANGNISINSATDNGLRFQVTGDGFFSGSVAIGTTAITDVNLYIRKNLSGSVFPSGLYIDSTVQSTSTTGAAYISTSVSTQAATFTLPNLYHFRATQSTIGAGSTVTNQYGYIAEASLIGATNNYGFYGNIASGTGRWNLYMNGSAANFLAGNLGIGITTTVRKLQINESSANTVGIAITNTATTSNGLQLLVDGSGGAALWNYANTELTFGTNNNERVRITNTGNLGLGVTPSYKMHVFNAGSVTSAIESSGAGTSSALRFISPSNYWLITNDGTNAHLTFNRGGTDLIRFSNLGNLLVGTTTDAGFRLDVNGTMRVSGASTLSGFVTINNSVSTSLNQNATTYVAVTNTDIGVNTKAEFQAFSRNGGTTRFGRNSNLTTAYKILNASDAYVLNETLGDFAILNDNASGSIKMASGGSSTAHFTIASTGAATFSSSVTAQTGLFGGNLGGANQRVANFRNSGGNGYIEIQGSGSVAGQIISDATGQLYFTTNATAGTAGTTRLFINSSGQIGVGTLSLSAWSGQSVQLGARASIASVTDDLMLTNNAFYDGTNWKYIQSTLASNYYQSAGVHVWRTAPSGTAGNNITWTEQMRVFANGNLLVGSSATDNGQRLQIEGSVRVAGDIIITGGNGYDVINSGGNTTTALRSTSGGTSIMSSVSNGLHIAVGTENAGDLILASNNTERIRLSSNGFFSQINATNPSSSITDSYIQYSADVTAGNAAPHFRTENGAVIKLYQETTGVGNAIFSQGGGNSVLDDSTFDGYTLRQIVKALRNQGILQ